MRNQCSIPDCLRLVVGWGWCILHYRRWRSTGDPLTVRQIHIRGSAPQRFWQHVSFNDGCWEWQAGRSYYGYGVFAATPADRRHAAHRYAYEFCVGSIPTGLQIDHLCRNHACVNPDHMELVPQRENMRRGFGASALNARKTHCLRGHPFDGANLRRRSDGRRDCYICKRNRERRGRVAIAE